MSQKNQQGMALVAVLLFLILIMLIGTIAVRQSAVDLKIATSDQAGTLAFNSSDSVLAHIEQAGSNTSNRNYARMMSLNNGVLGYFLVQAESKIGQQVSFCYRPNNSNLFTQRDGYIRALGSNYNTSNSANVVCNPDNANDYTSARSTAMTQVTVTGLENSMADNFTQTQTGVSIQNTAESYSPKIRMDSYSVLPALADVSARDVRQCLGRPVGDATAYNVNDGDMRQCLINLGVPAAFIAEEGTLVIAQVGGYSQQNGITDVCTGNADCRTAAGLR